MAFAFTCTRKFFARNQASFVSVYFIRNVVMDVSVVQQVFVSRWHVYNHTYHRIFDHCVWLCSVYLFSHFWRV